MLTACLFSTCFSQKAYDIINYTGKADGYSINLAFANGYVDASTIKATDTKSTIKFTIATEGVDSAGNLKFYHYASKDIKAADYIVLKEMRDNYETLPGKINGFYFLKNKMYPFVLTKKKM